MKRIMGMLLVGLLLLSVSTAVLADPQPGVTPGTTATSTSTNL